MLRLARDAGLGDGLLDDVTRRRVFRDLDDGVGRLLADVVHHQE